MPKRTVPAAGEAMPASGRPDDPVFAAIERHRQALSAAEQMEEGTKSYEALNAAATEVEAALLRTPPQTAAGLREQAGYLLSIGAGESHEDMPGFLQALLRSPLLPRAAGASVLDANADDHAKRLAERVHFERLYADWLTARALAADPDQEDTDEAADARIDNEYEAAMRLLSTPAPVPWMIWKKWEIMVLWQHDDHLGGEAEDNRTAFAMTAIKADLLRFGALS